MLVSVNLYAMSKIVDEITTKGRYSRCTYRISIGCISDDENSCGKQSICCYPQEFSLKEYGIIYSRINQLTSLCINDTVIIYRYDENGNIVSQQITPTDCEPKRRRIIVIHGTEQTLQKSRQGMLSIHTAMI